jgi:hypothetical protein
MKFLSTLILVVLFSSVVLADGNQGSGGRGYNGDVRTVTVKGGITTEDGDPPPPPPPPCVPSSTVDCGGNQGSGGREASVSIMIFFQKYVIGYFV